MNVLNPFMSVEENIVSFSPSLEITDDTDLSQFDANVHHTHLILLNILILERWREVLNQIFIDDALIFSK